jgi:TolB-like protein/Tfp pilus assembly protein PilF
VKPTSDGRDESAAEPSFFSSPSFQSAFGHAQKHKIGTGAVALVLIALVTAVAYYGFVSAARGPEIDSIAVLPFENLTGDPDLAYVSDGLSDSLIDRLSQLPQLRVISRKSSFRFHGKDVDVRDAANQLGVRSIVTGSVSRVGDELSVRVDVVDAIEDRHIAGGQYRRKIEDLVGLENEVSRTATEQLRLKLTSEQSERIKESPTENSEAYRYYLSGLVELNGPNDVRGNALDYFERAVALDPNFAPAHAEIAWVYWARANESSDPRELMPKAKAAAERALELDPELAKSHVMRAMVDEYEFDWQGAEREYRRGIELSPNLDFARNNFAYFLSIRGRQDEALAELEEQRVRDPINARLALLQKGIILTQARRFDDALKAYQEAQVAEPSREIPNFSLGYAYGGKGLYNEAAGYYKKSIAALGGDDKYSQPLVYLAATYARIPEKRAEARAILAKIESMRGYSSPALLAAVYSALDERDKAMELLEQAYIRRDVLLRFVGTGYEYDGLRDDPRFTDLLRRIGLADTVK